MTEFRLATEQDLEKIVHTYNASIPKRMATADLETVSVESKREWFREHSAEARPIWIVLYNSEYAGWMSFSSFYGRPAYQATAELSVYLEENMQGKGLGKDCLNFAIRFAPKIGVHTLLGFIFAHNTISLKLFYSSGFEQWALLPAVADMDGQKRDLIIVGRKI